MQNLAMETPYPLRGASGGADVKRLKVTGTLASQGRPEKMVAFTRLITAGNIAEAMDVYRNHLRGVEKAGLLSIEEIKY